MSKITIHSHVDLVEKELEERIPIVLEALGIEAQKNSIKEITTMKAVDTGRLRNSITWVTTNEQGQPNTQGGEPAKSEDYEPHSKAETNKVYIGTNVEYAPYIELGTYKMASRPFLKKAIAEHQDDYKKIIEEGLK